MNEIIPHRLPAFRWLHAATRRRLGSIVASSLLALGPFSAFALAERPTAPQLFPETTFGYIRVDDSRDLKAKMAETSTGRLGNDPELKPILQEFYGTLVSSLEQMQEAIGVNLDELLSIPNGELSIAVFPSKDDARPVSVAALIEAGDELPALQLIINRAETAMSERGGNRTEEMVGNIVVVSLVDQERADRQIAYFVDQGVFVACSNVNDAKQLAQVWQGNLGEGKERFKPLAENRKFLTTMSQCAGAEGERPQASFYVDPLAIVRTSLSSSGSGTTVLAVLPAIGVDGIQAVGGSWILGTKEFDSILHAHLSLASPRRGILQVLRPKSGSTVPEGWIPDSAASYSTLNWDIDKTVDAIANLFDTFRGEDAFKNEVLARPSERLGFDLKTEVIDQMAGRITLIQGFAKPFRLNSGTNLYAFKVKDPERFATNVVRKLETVIPNLKFSRKPGAKAEIYVQENVASTSDVIRAPRLCYGMLEDYFVVSDDTFLIDEVLATADGRRSRLADALDYKLIVDHVKEQLGEDRKTSILLFQRPEESLQVFYEMARDPANRERLKSLSENNPLFKSLSTALEKHELPPFSVVQKYLVPTGAFVTEDETGLHYTAFSLKRE